jgi:parvulin-like peptidyl-prolyl isomerase
MGNKVRFGGAEFWAVARKHSQEKNAENGGYHDWTTLGDLRISKQLSAEIFTIELNKLSKIIEDDEGLLIIRVLDREEAHLIPFSEAQIDIKTNLKNEALNKSYRDYVDKLRDKTPIWTADKGYLPRNARSNRATDETQMKHR